MDHQIIEIIIKVSAKDTKNSMLEKGEIMINYFSIATNGGTISIKLGP